MRVWRLWAVCRLLPSDIVRDHPTWVGIQGLRHKARHKISVPHFRDVPTKSTEGGVVHSTSALTGGGTGAIYAGQVLPLQTMSTISVEAQ
jgi:hypothetical protein